MYPHNKKEKYPLKYTSLGGSFVSSSSIGTFFWLSTLSFFPTLSILLASSSEDDSLSVT